MRDWEFARQRLVPVIGEGGFRSLFARSLHLAQADFPWLAAVSKAAAEPFVALQASLESETAAHAEQGGRALLATFTGLLHGLIGEALTSRLLDGGATGTVPNPRSRKPKP